MFNSLQGPQITIVLQTGFKYYVPEDVLCKLPFFALALRAGYRETLTKVVNLPEDDPELVRCLLQYLLTGEYQVPPSVEANTRTQNGDNKEPRIQLKLFHTSVLIIADKYLCDGLSRLAAINVRKVVLSPMAFVHYIVSVYEMTPRGSRFRIGYFAAYGFRDELLIIHPQWTSSSHTRASILRLLSPQSSEDEFAGALDRCPELAIDLLSVMTKGTKSVPLSIMQCPGAAKLFLFKHCKEFGAERPFNSTGEFVGVPWGWWKGQSRELERNRDSLEVLMGDLGLSTGN
ncbi:hypothetical protein L211DRAFT_844863 [Terfezia boudieri ATCC MYA-4762]|uniref:BTB domain-containing protein n=1 Tax=Terfezia boudieri ATCC MYA-4762 TaxID=1051890 RepID=A0A3N4M477_9PEZI|nr:hypothetical protein L211DRAFT_844863 [Terfezia boudieri ATCC MYA-4762]